MAAGRQNVRTRIRSEEIFASVCIHRSIVPVQPLPTIRSSFGMYLTRSCKMQHYIHSCEGKGSGVGVCRGRGGKNSYEVAEWLKLLP